jgi:hypothetical protein
MIALSLGRTTSQHVGPSGEQVGCVAAGGHKDDQHE